MSEKNTDICQGAMCYTCVVIPILTCNHFKAFGNLSAANNPKWLRVTRTGPRLVSIEKEKTDKSLEKE